jgi:hypothetical protein
VRAVWSVLPLLCIGGCGGKPAPPPPAQPTAPARIAPAGSQELVFTGMCDASGAVALSRDLFAVADDEDNVLRIYDANHGGAPISSSDVTGALPIEAVAGKKRSAKRPEIDIEAATRIGDVALWITSHGRSSSGKERPERLFLFGTTAPATATKIDVIGMPYTSLLDDLSSDARFSSFNLAEAATHAPKEPGGVNIEGMTARPDGSVFIGFRNPVPEGRALLVPLLNPLESIRGRPAKIGDPVLLDLGGLGVRALSWWRGRYLIVAGPIADEAPFRLFAWRGEGGAEPVNAVDLRGFNPEAFFTAEEADRILLLSDDGAALIEGTPCKRLEERGKKRFRGRWVAMRLIPPTTAPFPG